MARGFLKRLLKHHEVKDHERPDSHDHARPSAKLTELVRPNESSKANGHTDDLAAQDVTGLWGDVYDSFLSSAESPDLKAVARLLRDQSKAPRPEEDTTNSIQKSPEWHLCNEVLHIAESKCSNLENTKLGSRCRRAYGEIIIWVNKFVSIGDAIAQIDPIHVGLPWAGVRTILMVSLHDQQTKTEIVERTADISRLICRYAVFEDVYLRDQSLLPLSVRAKLNSALRDLYTVVFRYLVEAVSHLQSSLGARIGRSLSMSDKVANLYSEIAKKEEDVLAYERLGIRSTSHNQYLEVRAKLCNYEDHLEDEKRKEVCEWISKIDYYSQYQEMQSRVLAQTGQWFSRTSEYQDWLNSESSSLLWLRGDAGTGKTSLMSSVIETFVERQWTDSREAMAYFYCSKTIGDNRQQDPKAILLSLLRQLSAPMPGLPLKAPVMEVYKTETARGSKEANLSIEKLTDLLYRIIHEEYEKVTLIVDALDECNANKRSQLLNVLIKLTYGPQKTVKTLMSSRDDPDIRSCLSSLPNFAVTATDNAGDIATFVKHEIDERLLGGMARKILKDRVAKHLNENAHGVFRWVALQVDALCDFDSVYTEADVDYLLPRLPSTLAETYSKTLTDLERLSPDSQRGILNVLKLVSCTAGHLNTYELITILAETPTTSQITWTTNVILKLGRGMIKLEQGRATFVFAHLSVKEYLESRSEFRPEATNAFAAEVCLRKYISPSKNTISAIGLNDIYSLSNLGRHLKDAGPLRQQEPLLTLAQEFFAYPTTKAFDTWNQHCFQCNISSSPEPDHFTHRDAIKSRPAFPLFMACLYGLNEFVEPILRKCGPMLDIRNYRGHLPLEVAAEYGNFAASKSIFDTSMEIQPAAIRSESWLDAAGQSGDPKVWEHAIQNVSDLPFVEILPRVAGNMKHGKAMVTSLLERISTIDEGDFCRVLRESASFEVLEMVQTHAGITEYTYPMLQAAIDNPDLNPKLVELVLSKNPNLEVSTSCFLTLSRSYFGHGSDDWKTEVAAILLKHTSRCEISEEILYEAICSHRHGIKALDILLQNCPFNTITEDLLTAPFLYHFGSTAEKLHWLLSCNLQSHISRAVLRKVLGQPLYYQESLTTAMAGRDLPEIFQEDVYILVEGCDAEIGDFDIDILLQCKVFGISEWFMTECIRRLMPHHINTLLNMPRAFSVSNTMIHVAASYSKHPEVFGQLIKLQNDPELDRSEELLVNIISNTEFAVELLGILSKRSRISRVNERCIVAAVTNVRGGMDVIEALTSFHDIPLQQFLTEPALLAATKCDNLDFVTMFKLHQPDFRVSEELMTAALRQNECNNAILKLFLSQQQRCLITDSMVDIAAQCNDESILHCLMEQAEASAQTAITSRLSVVKAEEPFVDQQVTFDLILDAMRGRGIHRYHDTGDLEDMIARYEGPVIDVCQLIEAAAKRNNGKFFVQFLLKNYPDTTITNTALQNAAANLLALPSLLSFLLDKSGRTWDNLDTTVLKAAAGNEYYGTQMMELLFAKYPSSPKVENEVVIAALQNTFCGRSILEMIVRAQPDLKISKEFIDAAADNLVIGSILIQDLLNIALNQSSKTAIDAIFSKLGTIKNGLFNSLFMAVCYKNVPILDLLLSRDVPLTHVQGELGTALNVAVHVGNHDAVRKLLDKGCDIEFESKMYGTPLNTAYSRGHIDILRTLVEHGADMGKGGLTSVGRLGKALRNGRLEVAEALISLGVSVTAKDKQGMVAIHHAAECEVSSAGLDCILKLEPNVDAEDSYQWTALHWAAKCGATDNVGRLLAAGARRDKCDKSGRTPLDVAMYCGQIHLRSKLMESGVPDSTVIGRDWDNATVCDACELDTRGDRFRCSDCDYTFCFRCIHDVKEIHDPSHEVLEF